MIISQLQIELQISWVDFEEKELKWKLSQYFYWQLLLDVAFHREEVNTNLFKSSVFNDTQIISFIKDSNQAYDQRNNQYDQLYPARRSSQNNNRRYPQPKQNGWFPSGNQNDNDYPEIDTNTRRQYPNENRYPSNPMNPSRPQNPFGEPFPGHVQEPFPNTFPTHFPTHFPALFPNTFPAPFPNNFPSIFPGNGISQSSSHSTSSQRSKQCINGVCTTKTCTDGVCTTSNH